jgi:hypothetical protein
MMSLCDKHFGAIDLDHADIQCKLAKHALDTTIFVVEYDGRRGTKMNVHSK